MKRQPKTFVGCINGIHLQNLELIPNNIMGKSYKKFNSDEWISFICLLHTKAKKQEKEITALKRKLRIINKYLTK